MERVIVDVRILGRIRKRAKVTCDCGKDFVVMFDETRCDCGQLYNLFGQQLRATIAQIESGEVES